MSDSEQRWLAVAIAVATIERAEGQGARAARNRLGGWIADRRVGLLAGEVIMWALPPPDPNPPPPPPSIRLDDGTFVHNITPGGPFQASHRTIASDQTLAPTDIDLMIARGAMDARAEWWATGELELLINSWPERKVFYGLAVNEADLLRCMRWSGLAAVQEAPPPATESEPPSPANSGEVNPSKAALEKWARGWHAQQGELGASLDWKRAGQDALRSAFPSATFKNGDASRIASELGLSRGYSKGQ